MVDSCISFQQRFLSQKRQRFSTNLFFLYRVIRQWSISDSKDSKCHVYCLKYLAKLAKLVLTKSYSQKSQLRWVDRPYNWRACWTGKTSICIVPTQLPQSFIFNFFFLFLWSVTIDWMIPSIWIQHFWCEHLNKPMIDNIIWHIALQNSCAMKKLNFSTFRLHFNWKHTC